MDTLNKLPFNKEYHFTLPGVDVESLVIQTFDDQRERKSPELAKHFLFNREKIIDFQEKGAGAYWCVNPGGRTIDTTTAFARIALDLDVCKDESDKRPGVVKLNPEEITLKKIDLAEKLYGMRIPPSGIVDTKNGLQPYWIFDKSIPLDTVEERRRFNDNFLKRLLKGLENEIGMKNERPDVCGVYRLPGSYHLKTPNNPFLITASGDGKPVSLKEFVSIYLAPEDPKPEVRVFAPPKDGSEVSYFKRPAKEMLSMISGHEMVGGEKYDFTIERAGKCNIIITPPGGNPTVSGQFVNLENNTIGSGGGDASVNIERWILWYGIYDLKKIRETLDSMLGKNAKVNLDKLKAKKKLLTKCSEASNGERFALSYGDKVRFDHFKKKWLIWGGHRWIPDATENVKKMAVKDARNHVSQASKQIKDKEVRQKVVKWAMASESRSRVESTIYFAKSFEPIADTGQGWDEDLMILSCPNGILDLRTGILREGRPEEKISMVCGTKYDKEARCPRWEKFISEVFDGKDDLIRYVKKALGYSITGSMKEQVIFFGYGSGSNGKSVLFSTVRDVLGEYAHDADERLFVVNDGGGTNDLVELRNKRMVLSSETLTTSKLNEKRLKSLTGGERIRARQLYQVNEEFLPTCKIWLFLNHRPQVSDDSFGFWRRVRSIPFTVTFTGDRMDSELGKKLREESSGILNWLVEGALLWQKEGLKDTPEDVKESTEEYRNENDNLYDFVSDRILEVEGSEVRSMDLWTEYVNWADTYSVRGTDRLSQTAFSLKMKDRYVSKTTKRGTFFKNICIKLKI